MTHVDWNKQWNSWLKISCFLQLINGSKQNSRSDSQIRLCKSLQTLQVTGGLLVGLSAGQERLTFEIKIYLGGPFFSKLVAAFVCPFPCFFYFCLPQIQAVIPNNTQCFLCIPKIGYRGSLHTILRVAIKRSRAEEWHTGSSCFCVRRTRCDGGSCSASAQSEASVA